MDARLFTCFLVFLCNIGSAETNNEACTTGDTDVLKLTFNLVGSITTEANQPIESIAVDAKNFLYVQKPFNVSIYDQNLKLRASHNFKNQIFGNLTKNLKGEVVVFDGKNLLHQFQPGGKIFTSKEISGFVPVDKKITSTPKYLPDGSMVFVVNEKHVTKIIDDLAVELNPHKFKGGGTAPFLLNNGHFLVADCDDNKDQRLLIFDENHNLLRNDRANLIFGCKTEALHHSDDYFIIPWGDEAYYYSFQGWSSSGRLDGFGLQGIRKVESNPVIIDKKIFFLADSQLNFIDRDAVKKTFFSFASRDIKRVNLSINVSIPFQNPLVIDYENSRYILLYSKPKALEIAEKLLAFDNNGKLVTLAPPRDLVINPSSLILAGNTVLLPSKDKIVGFKFGPKLKPECQKNQGSGNDSDNVEETAIESQVITVPASAVIDKGRFD
ncbi:MAG: hypothetical protein A4S09_04720 [Proteobacteria bacterium SG_bin7]|nr:MAG: hypothetical protein A4S09_04720 [Proteobacteria bacterium SG_bin7]